MTTHNKKEFLEWCKGHGISMHPDDWLEWWDCWKTAYESCLNDGWRNNKHGEDKKS